VTAALARAVLIPFDDQGKAPIDTAKIELDFNPETLTLKVSNTLEDVPGRKGRQRKQFVGSSSSTLTFDAYFDSTRPKNLPGEEPESDEPEQLDVRRRTASIAGLLQVSDPNAKQPAPKRVRFAWGSILFDGIIDSYTEVLEYFSPEGVPLRAKVSLSFKEQKFEYQIDETKRAALAAFDRSALSPGGPRSADDALGGLGATLGQAGDVASQNGLDSLLDIGISGGLSFDAGLSISGGIGASASLDLGLGVDLGFSAGVSIDIAAGAAVDVFGGAVVAAAAGAGVDLSASSRGAAKAPAGSTAGRTPTSWAPAGPTAGSSAAGLASIVHAQRASGAPPDGPAPGGSFTATEVAARAPEVPIPVRGSPPRVAASLGPTGPSALFASRAYSRPIAGTSLAGDRPRWEQLSSGSGGARSSRAPCCAACGERVASPPSSSSASRGGCGCSGRRS
jgi:hypothetical protein